MNPLETDEKDPKEQEKENELLGAIEDVAPQENVPYDEDDDGIEIISENQNDAENDLLKKVQESHENERNLSILLKEKEKEKRLLKRELKQLQEELFAQEIQISDTNDFSIDLQIQKEINLLKSKISEDQKKKESLEFDLEELKKKEYSHGAAVKSLKIFNDLIEENEELEKFIRTEYYETAHETIHAYKMLAEDLKHEIIQIEQTKEDLENEQKKARESSSDLRRQISEVKSKEHKLQEDLETLKASKAI